jgi:hypothetical protein
MIYPFFDDEEDEDETPIPANTGLCDACGDLVYHEGDKLCEGCKEEI